MNFDAGQLVRELTFGRYPGATFEVDTPPGYFSRYGDDPERMVIRCRTRFAMSEVHVYRDEIVAVGARRGVEFIDRAIATAYSLATPEWSRRPFRIGLRSGARLRVVERSEAA